MVACPRRSLVGGTAVLLLVTGVVISDGSGRVRSADCPGEKPYKQACSAGPFTTCGGTKKIILPGGEFQYVCSPSQQTETDDGNYGCQSAGSDLTQCLRGTSSDWGFCIYTYDCYLSGMQCLSDYESETFTTAIQNVLVDCPQ